LNRPAEEIGENLSQKKIDRYWYGKPLDVPLWLRALTLVFRPLVWLRRWSYRILFFRVYRPKVPLVVVGNISVGGTGKTPMVVWLVELFKRAGLKPGVVSRGYGGLAENWPQQARPDSDPKVIGDEAVLLARRCLCPMAVGPNRVAAVKALLEAHKDVDVIISDDGLQHYALGRDVEIVVIDGERRFGNGYCLPAGPLREPETRLKQVDFRVVNGGDKRYVGEYAMKIKSGKFINLKNPSKKLNIEDLKSKQVHAVAGIGNPDRFFNQLKLADISFKKHIFPDHHPFSEEDLNFKDEKIILMTEKDAVKCERFATDRQWYLSVEAELDPKFAKALMALLEKSAARRKQKWTINYSIS